ncbi:MAG: carbohydrate kinase family protein [Pyrinomonadaceae bacterium]|nr:carbohydrate kinase family protein [Pyrinomonadaceae bacterium]MCX7639633.1 carbohydrate kinase family protein [Pyrinomonadaceae bacterium]MDW8303349.1 carbohydrate kinase family protein [Acidobacteriota bacterium]
MRFPFKLAQNKEFDVVGFGTNAVDFLIVVPEYPKFNSKIELTSYYQLAGGEVASTMVGLSRLGLKTAYVGRFGDDAAGDFGLQSLRNENVNLDYAEVILNSKTQIAFILIDEKSGERTVIWKRDNKLAYTEPPLDVADKGKVFHATAHDTKACILMAQKAKSGGTVVSIDIDKPFNDIEKLIPLIDIFISAEEFPEKLLGIEDKKKALREIKSRYGCSIVGVTLGEQGSLILCEDTFVETRGFSVPGGCKDTTGAGDAFRVGFLYGLLTGETVERSAQIANLVAALKCRQIGARTALPTKEELYRFLSELDR